MKKTYIFPSTTIVPVLSCAVCNVGSIHGDSGLGFGGGSDGSDATKIPM